MGHLAPTFLLREHQVKYGTVVVRLYLTCVGQTKLKFSRMVREVYYYEYYAQNIYMKPCS